MAVATHFWTNVRFLEEAAGTTVVDLENDLVIVPAMRIALPNAEMNREPMEFMNWLTGIMNAYIAARERAEVRRALSQHRRLPRAVPDNYGHTFTWSRNAPAPQHSCCSICMEEFKPRNKIRQLCSSGCRFHHNCIKKWFKKSSKCPNCNTDCSHALSVANDI